MVTRRPRKPAPVEIDVPTNVHELFEGEYADWNGEEGDWQNTLCDAIQRGMFDTMLKPLARAIFDRRDVLTGKTPGESFKGVTEDPEEDSAEQKPAHVASVRATVGQARPAFQSDVTLADSIHPVPNGYTGKTFAHNGSNWPRDAFIGKTFRIPASVDTDYLRGLLVKIKGCGPKMVSVEFLELPPKGTTWRTKHDDKKPCFLPYSTVESHMAKA